MRLQAGWVGQLSLHPLQRWQRWTASSMSWSTLRGSASAWESLRPSRWPQRSKQGRCHFSNPCPFTQVWCRCRRGLLWQVRALGSLSGHNARNYLAKYCVQELKSKQTHEGVTIPLTSFNQLFLFDCPSAYSVHRWWWGPSFFSSPGLRPDSVSPSCGSPKYEGAATCSHTFWTAAGLPWNWKCLFTEQSQPDCKCQSRLSFSVLVICCYSDFNVKSDCIVSINLPALPAKNNTFAVNTHRPTSRLDLEENAVRARTYQGVPSIRSVEVT